MIHIEDAVIAAEGARRFDGHLARPATGAGPGLAHLQRDVGRRRQEARDGRRLRPARLVRDRAQHVLALGVHRRRAVRSGRQGVAAAAGVRLRHVGRRLPDRGAMAARLAALQRQDRGDRLLHGRAHRVPRGVARRRRCRHRALRARHRQAPRRGSQDGRPAPAPLRPQRRAHSEIRDRRGRRCRRRQRAISRFSSTPAPDTASSTGRSRPTT